MSDATPLIEVPGSPAESGFEHGRVVAHQLTPSFLDGFVGGFCSIKGLSREQMGVQALAWFDGLPAHFQTEIDAMARGARTRTSAAIEYLFADIAPAGAARPAGPGSSIQGGPIGDGPMDDGPMCSAMLLPGPCVARNCDWYTHLLTRGTAAVVHRTPGRHPVMALGIFGDIDVDTGVNAAGLWLHAHTLWAKPKPRTGKPRLSWLFWLRECLETCATIDEVDAMLGRVERDRGVILVAAEIGSRKEGFGRGAIFEATIDSHTRADMEGPMCATNHHRHKHPGDPDRLARAPESSTTARYQRLLELAGEGADLEAVLGDGRVEMRTPRFLRTIYAATLRAGDRSPMIRFAHGSPDGTPASSSGTWREIAWPFGRVG